MKNLSSTDLQSETLLFSPREQKVTTISEVSVDWLRQQTIIHQTNVFQFDWLR